MIKKQGFEEFLEFIESLRERLGLGQSFSDRRKEFEQFCGIWTEEDAEIFEETVKSFSVFDSELHQ